VRCQVDDIAVKAFPDATVNAANAQGILLHWVTPVRPAAGQP
jgi:hypothetical protein